MAAGRRHRRGGGRACNGSGRTHVTAYFDNSNGIYAGDDVVILGVQRRQDRQDRTAARPGQDLLLVRRQIQGARRRQGRDSVADAGDGASHPVDTGLHRRAGDDGRRGDPAASAPPSPWNGTTSASNSKSSPRHCSPPNRAASAPSGAFINTAADNLRGQGPDIRDTIIKLSQAISALGDHSSDLFTTLKNLSILVSALHDSSDLLRHLNQNLAAVTSLLADDPNAVANAVRDLNDVAGDVTNFVADNREALGTTSDKLAVGDRSAVNESLDDIKQSLHVGPTAFQNFVNIYNPRKVALTGAVAVNNFANPIQFLCCGGAGGIATRRRAVGQVVRAVSGADLQEPSVQLPAPRLESLRRRHGAAQRNHLQRGLAAAGLRPPAEPADRAVPHGAAAAQRPRRREPDRTLADGARTRPPFVPARLPVPTEPGRRPDGTDGATRRWTVSRSRHRRRVAASLLAALVAAALSGCGVCGLPRRELAYRCRAPRAAARAPTRSRRRCPMSKTSNRTPGFGSTM